MNYYKYIQSPEWYEKREDLYEARNWRCEICGSSYIEAHHRSYLNLGVETGNDLSLLCCKCHTIAHKYNKIHERFPMENGCIICWRPMIAIFSLPNKEEITFRLCEWCRDTFYLEMLKNFFIEGSHQ